MNLKKDTEYALRILSCLYNSGCVAIPFNSKKGMSLYDLCIKTGIPRISLQRVCEKLKAKDLIAYIRADDNHSIRYQTIKDIEYCSLLSVIEALERQCRMFLLFDQKTAYYHDNRHVFKGIDERYRRFFDTILLKELL